MQESFYAKSAISNQNADTAGGTGEKFAESVKSVCGAEAE